MALEEASAGALWPYVCQDVVGSDALNLVGWVGAHPVVHPPLLAWALKSRPDRGVGLQDLVGGGGVGCISTMGNPWPAAGQHLMPALRLCGTAIAGHPVCCVPQETRQAAPYIVQQMQCHF